MRQPLQQAFRFPGQEPGQPGRRNLVIEAGAGTGKTTAIVGQVLELLLSLPALLPERIVLMTFTEKAAGEIAERIHQALGELQAAFESGSPAVRWPAGSAHPVFEVPEDRREEYSRTCGQQLGRIDGLRSQTIHSFCQSILRTYPIEAGLDPQFRIVEGFERALLYNQLYDKWADRETRENDPAILAQWEALLAQAGYFFRMRDLVFSLAARRDLLDDSSYSIGDIAEIAPQVVSAVEELRKRHLEEGSDASAVRLFAYLRQNPLPPMSVPGWIEFFAPVAAEIRNIDLTATGTVKNAMKAIRGSGKKGDSIHDVLVSHGAAVALLQLARRFVAFVDAEKYSLGVADFDDLLLRTASLLDDPRIAEQVRQGFDFIFVDEFQDTDRTQVRIIEALACDSSGAFVPGRTVVVGDPKQSIYGFRRADPETYQRFSDRLISGGAEARRLVEQYRSHPHLVEAFNGMFRRLFADASFDANVFRPAYRDLVPGLPARPSERSPLTILEVAPASDRHIAEAEAVASWIQARGGPLHRYAVLFRRLSKLDPYLDTLERRGIEYVLPQTRNFLDRRAPVDLLAVLRAIAFPFDRGAEVSAARTPYFALTDVEISEGILERHAGWDQYLARLGEYRQAAERLTVSDTIDLLIDASAIESVYRQSADQRRSLRHLEHLRSIAFAYDQKRGGSLRQFVSEIDHRRDEPDEMEPSLADDQTNAVRILTVHAAKGLEFDTVILPDLSFPSRGNDVMQLFAVEDPRSLVVSGSAQTFSAQFRFTGAAEPLKEVARKRDDAELRRLFYVAATRARNEVLFVCGPEQRREGFFGLLCETFQFEKGTFDSKSELLGAVSFERAEPGKEEVSSTRRRLRDTELETRLAGGVVVPLTLSSPSLPPLSAPGPRATSRAAGTLLHRVLELWDGVHDLEPVLQRAAGEAAADRRVLSVVRDRLARLRGSASFRRIMQGQALAREMTLRFVDSDGALVERRLDRLIAENGREVVVDYKSGSPDPGRLDRDRDQVTRYCRALQAITGRRPGGLLWYIDADEDRLVEVEPVESSSNASV